MLTKKTTKVTDKVKVTKKHLYEISGKSIPKDCRQKGKRIQRKYDTYQDQYKAARSEINECSKDEKVLLDILITREIESTKRMIEHKSSISFYISIFSLLIVTTNVMFSNSNIIMALSDGKSLLSLIGVTCLFFISYYSFIDIYYSRRLDRYIYISLIIKNIITHKTQNNEI